MIIESVAAASAILSSISQIIQKMNEVGQGGIQAVEMMSSFSSALDNFEATKKGSMLQTLSPQELLRLEHIKVQRDRFQKSLHDLLVVHDPELLERWESSMAAQKAAHKREMEAVKARKEARARMIRQVWIVMGVTAIGLICAFILIGGVILIFR
tara:strand:+ start:983 stop:1447 length:465 start_codon:yes stop_codon:yes gene_type:complete